jgi:hypothetical protein
LTRQMARKIENVSVVFFHDADDKVAILDDTKELTSQFPGDSKTKLIITKGLGHFKGIGDSTILATISEFLK